MATYSGDGGKVTIGSAVLHVTGWNIDHSANADEYATSDTSSYKAVVFGVKRWNGSLQAKLDGTTPQTGLLAPGTKAAGSFYTNGTLNCSGDCGVVSSTIEVDPDDGNAVIISAEFVGNGPLSVAGLTPA